MDHVWASPGRNTSFVCDVTAKSEDGTVVEVPKVLTLQKKTPSYSSYKNDISTVNYMRLQIEFIYIYIFVTHETRFSRSPVPGHSFISIRSHRRCYFLTGAPSTSSSWSPYTTRAWHSGFFWATLSVQMAHEVATVKSIRCTTMSTRISHSHHAADSALLTSTKI